MEHTNACNSYMTVEISSGRVIATYSEGRIYKVDVKSEHYGGESSVEVFIDNTKYSWTTDKIYLVGYMMYGIPVSKDGRFIFAQQDMQGLLCLDATNGNVIWKTQSKAEISHVLVGDQFLCCSKSKNEIQLIDLETGKVAQSYRTPFDNRFEVLTDHIILNHTRSKFWEIISADNLEVLQTISDNDLWKNRRAIEQFYKNN